MNCQPPTIIQCPLCGEGELFALNRVEKRDLLTGQITTTNRYRDERTQPDMLFCPQCRAVGTMEQLERRAGADTHRIFLGFDESGEAVMVDADVYRSYLDDLHRGTPGGSRSSKSYSKEDKLKAKKLRPEVDDSVQWSRTVTVQPKQKRIHVRGLQVNATEVRDSLADFLVQKVAPTY